MKFEIFNYLRNKFSKFFTPGVNLATIPQVDKDKFIKEILAQEKAVSTGAPHVPDNYGYLTHGHSAEAPDPNGPSIWDNYGAARMGGKRRLTKRRRPTKKRRPTKRR